ncbi:hypothetical protein KI387_010124, partial [Taxus chinensis]
MEVEYGSKSVTPTRRRNPNSHRTTPARGSTPLRSSVRFPGSSLQNLAWEGAASSVYDPPSFGLALSPWTGASNWQAPPRLTAREFYTAGSRYDQNSNDTSGYHNSSTFAGPGFASPFSVASQTPTTSGYHHRRHLSSTEKAPNRNRNRNRNQNQNDFATRLNPKQQKRSPQDAKAPAPSKGLAAQDELVSSFEKYYMPSIEETSEPEFSFYDAHSSVGDFEEDDDYDEKPKRVGMLGLFAYASWGEKLLMALGSLGAFVNGGSLP